MSNFKMMTRPKKPTKDSYLTQQLCTGMTVKEFQEQLRIFMDKYPHLTEQDIEIEYDYDGDGSGLIFTAVGKPHSVYQKELTKYNKDLKAYKAWKDEHAAYIATYKVEEKKRIAKAKLEKAKSRLAKELIAVESKLKNI